MSELLSDTGLNLPENYTEDQFLQAGQLLGRIEKGMQWAIGDWYNAIPWGDKKAACERVGLNFNSANKYAGMCKVFPMSYRICNCSFSDHEAVMNQQLTQDQRMGLLEKSSKNNWSRDRLRAEKDTLLGKSKQVKVEGFDNKVDSLITNVTNTLPNNVSKKLKKKVEKEVTKMAEDLKHDFDRAVLDVVVDRTREQRETLKKIEDDVKEKQINLNNMRKNISLIMTREEFRLIKGCLHPDRVDIDRVKLGKAFTIFCRLEESIPKLSKLDAEKLGW